MSYSIVYQGRAACSGCAVPVRPKKVHVVVVGLFFAVSLCLFKLYPEGAKRLVYPGDVKVTEAAAEQLVFSIRDGQPVLQALENFCEDIIAHGQ